MIRPGRPHLPVRPTQPEPLDDDAFVFSWTRPDPEDPYLNARAWKQDRDRYRAALEQIRRLQYDRAEEGPVLLLVEASRLAEEALR